MAYAWSTLKSFSASIGPAIGPSHLSFKGSLSLQKRINCPFSLPGINIINESDSLNPVK